jgi:hypothetical protein
MAFVRKKRVYVGGYIDYHYLVESRREGRKVRQVVLAYLGRHKTVEAAWRAAEREIGAASVLMSDLGEKIASTPGEYDPVLSPQWSWVRRELERLEARVEVFRRHAAGPDPPAKDEDSEQRYVLGAMARRAERARAEPLVPCWFRHRA